MSAHPGAIGAAREPATRHRRGSAPAARLPGVSRKRNGKRRSAAARSPDPRQLAAQVSSEIFAFAISPIRLDDARVVFYPSPAVIDFYLLEAKRLRDLGERARQRALSDLKKEDDGSFRPRNPSAVLDAMADLTTAVFLSVGAVEAFANLMIEDLPQDAKVDRGGKNGVVGQGEMVRQLSLRDKLHLAVPLRTGRPSVKGSHPWECFVALYDLRNHLTHIKDGGYSNDPGSPSGFGRLLRGDGCTCVDAAVGIINACDPDSLSPTLRSRLGVPIPGGS